MKCDGSCKKHVGETVKVIVFGEGLPITGWKFNYCQNAIKEDINNGFNVVVASKENTP